MPVDQEPARQGHYPGVPSPPRRHRRRRDEEGKVRRHVHVRHPVGAEHPGVHGREGDHCREAGRRATQRPRPAATYAYDMQPRPEHGFSGRLDVQVRGPGMVEVVPGVVSGQQREVSCLLDQERVRAHVRVLVQARGEQEAVTDAQQHEQHRRCRCHHPPLTGRARARRRAPGPGRHGRGGFALFAEAHLAGTLPVTVGRC